MRHTKPLPTLPGSHEWPIAYTGAHYLKVTWIAIRLRQDAATLTERGPDVAKLKKAFGRQISNWKAEALAANPGASDQDLANIINDMAKKQGFDYTISPERVRAKAKAPARKRATASPKATAAAPAPRNSAPAPRKADGQLVADLRSFVQLVGKDAARSLLNDMVDRL
jgi:hypothetical protein